MSSHKAVNAPSESQSVDEARLLGAAKKEGEKEHNEPPQATGLELFFDLIFVVIIHRVAMPLETHGDVFFFGIRRVGLGIQGIMMLWQITSDYVVQARIFGVGMKIRFFDCAVIFFVIMTATFMGLALHAHNARCFLVALLIGHLIPLVAYQALPCRGQFPREEAVKVLSAFPVIILGFAPPIIWNDPDMVVWTWCAIILQFFTAVIIYAFALEETGRSMMQKELMEERFGCVILIGIGEIVAAFVGNGVFSTDVLDPVYPAVFSGFTTAAACFFLHFTVNPRSWVPPHRENRLGGFWSLFLNVQIFAYAAIGAAYARVLEELAEEAEAHSERKLSIEHEMVGASGHRQETQQLLCFAVVLLLVSSACYQMLGSCDASRLRVPNLARCGTRFVVGATVGAFAFVDMSLLALLVLVPTSMIFLTIFETWAAGPTAGEIDLSLTSELTAEFAP